MSWTEPTRTRRHRPHWRNQSCPPPKLPFLVGGSFILCLRWNRHLALVPPKQVSPSLSSSSVVRQSSSSSEYVSRAEYDALLKELQAYKAETNARLAEMERQLTRLTKL